MEKKTVVIALGGNALGNTPDEQIALTKKTASCIVDMLETGVEIVVSHGNGPQVGMINNSFAYASQNDGKTPEVPFPECGAMSQGYIGYHLSQAITNELKKRNIKKQVACIVTQTLVDSNDEAFENPTKPVGGFLTKEQADQKSKENGYVYKEDSGRGYRMVVASPRPQKILEVDAAKALHKSGFLTIVGGGGGVPVVEKNGTYVGVPAVIDKDMSSAKIANDFGADMLIVLTAVEKVAINYNKPNQKDLDKLTIKECDEYIKEGHFAPGSMLPKIQACMNFINNSKNGKALITSLEKAKDGIEGKTGTVITK